VRINPPQRRGNYPMRQTCPEHRNTYLVGPGRIGGMIVERAMHAPRQFMTGGHARGGLGRSCVASDRPADR